ncbi:hypothetical protein PG995_006292 [Apiospora arundinis]
MGTVTKGIEIAKRKLEDMRLPRRSSARFGAGPYPRRRGHKPPALLRQRAHHLAPKATKNGESAPHALSQWMDGRGRGTTSWRARTLYSPTSMLALLVISYPDPKYRGLISRLGIE